MNPLKQLQNLGQSVYLDELSRRMIDDGTLAGLIRDDGIHGVTSNPAIFEKAIAGSEDYAGAIRELAGQGMTPEQVYEELVVADIQAAADLFREQYDASDGEHGYVSLEVDPRLADDTDGTLAEARHLWERLDRPNVFIKVPGTKAGVPAIRMLTAEGINVNVTLLFGLKRYGEVVEAYIQGLEERAASGASVNRVASVASFFLSRIDVLIDPVLQDKASGDASALLGKVAVANARLAYAHWQEVFGSERFEALARQGARRQKLLWASTGTKNPAYSETMYVEQLIGPDTVNTMPPATLDAYRNQGEPEDRLAGGIEGARAELEALSALGISLDEATEQLEREGVEKFVTPFESLMEAIREAMA